MDNQQKYAHIPGWGADLDEANRPAYPMERMPARLEGLHWSDPPEPQPQRIEVLCSTERPNMTPVFGTSSPPRGLSGSLRRYAFRHSENDLRHWLVLLLADRIDCGEGLIEDLSQGHVPNIYSEMGGNAELRHNPMGAARKALVVGAVIGLVALSMRNSRRHRRLR
ncbi:conserved hypothetical protein [Burkholderiales bacterium 8X]|nr:conserved hypothetical protein [Burkholderiales bacterium 8X]